MKRFTRIVSLLWIANFAIYAAVALWLGGDAVNGHSEAGHYFLAMHGHATEVSRGVFKFSRWYTYFLMAHFSIALVCGVIQQRAAKRLAPAA
jgi:hypothetical protein